ncbi:MAG: DUF2079 domain-containing protein, partial [Planctomycetes bacterium]|nr:DUF2079 domain-containing protein [Planctomycetota bacterium]
YPALGHANFNLIGRFNPDCLSVPFLLWAFHWACRRRWTGFFACAVGALLCKETVAPVVAAFSVFLWFRLRNGRAALATLALGVLWFALATGVVIPYFRGGSYDYIRLFYGDLGGQPGRVAAQVLAHPLSLAARLGSVDRVNFVVELLLPLAFLPLAAPSASAAGLPTLFCLLIADDASLHSILFHYRSSLIPVAFLGAICGARRTAAADRWRMTAAGLACAAFFSHYFLAPSPLSQSFDASLFKSTPRAEVVQDLRAAIPPDASVSATAKVALHFANRDNPYVAPNRADSADYVILDLVEPGREWRQAFLCRDRLLGDPRYGLRAFRDNILVFQKGLDDRAERMKRLRFDADELLWRNGRQINPHVKCLAVWFEPTASKSLGPVRECQMTVVWGCLKETDRDFCAAIAVGSPSSGYMVKGPYLPLYGVHPTFLWKVGEAFRETHTVQAPFDLSQAHSLPVGLHIAERVRADALARELEARYGPVVIWN